jgi:hypothetical protein
MLIPLFLTVILKSQRVDTITPWLFYNTLDHIVKCLQNRFHMSSFLDAKLYGAVATLSLASGRVVF